MNKNKFLTVFAKIFAILFLCSAIHGGAGRGVIAIQPFGKVDPAIIDALQQNISSFYNTRAVVLETKEIPDDLYYKEGDRYNASKLIRRMKKEYPKRYFKILAITEYDIYHKKGEYDHYGIVGLGLVGGRTAVVSTRRLKKLGGDDKKVLLQRVVKSSIHEIGHLMGLHHCDQTSYCIMLSAKGSVLTIDKKELRFCPYCLEKLKTLK